MTDFKYISVIEGKIRLLTDTHDIRFSIGPEPSLSSESKQSLSSESIGQVVFFTNDSWYYSHALTTVLLPEIKASQFHFSYITFRGKKSIQLIYTLINPIKVELIKNTTVVENDNKTFSISCNGTNVVVTPGKKAAGGANNLQNKTVDELRHLAQKRGIQLPSKCKKQDIINALSQKQTRKKIVA